eukprot:TRINITY_DN4842_c0_g1_i4.p1 TRINITY_DN4842_c0_g1~~TRINITY_DN4842_c0_g1_i4.p1  ORF type:complete len:388 (-),score=60.68 TRINITY_DN4842_c0_g1_i4:1015-2091(-)
MGARHSKARYNSTPRASDITPEQQDTLPRHHDGAVLGICSAGPGRIITCGDDKSLALLDLHARSIVGVWRGHSGPVNRVRFGTRTGLAYSASRDTTLAQWGQGEGPLASYRGHTLTVSALDLSADETRLWSGSRDTSVRLWDVSTGQQRGMVATPRNLVTCLKCMPGDEGANAVVQGGEDLKLRLWDFRAPSSVPAQTLDGFVYFPLCLDISEDGNYLLTGSKGFNSVGCEGRLWDRRTGQVVQEYNGHAQDVTACLLAPAALAASSGGAVITASKDQTIKVWGRESAHLLSDFAEVDCGMYTGLCIHTPDDAQLHRLCAATFTGGLYDLQLSGGGGGGEAAAPVLSVLSSVAGQPIE